MGGMGDVVDGICGDWKEGDWKGMNGSCRGWGERMGEITKSRSTEMLSYPDERFENSKSSNPHM